MLSVAHVNDVETYFTSKKAQLLKTVESNPAAQDFQVKGFFQNILDRILSLAPDLHVQGFKTSPRQL